MRLRDLPSAMATPASRTARFLVFIASVVLWDGTTTVSAEKPEDAPQSDETGGPDYAAELPRIPAKSPEESLNTLTVSSGYRVELIAAEPLVTDPVAACFAPDGRLYVVEMRDYSEQDQERLGRIRVLDDVDGDGRFDEATVFAENLSWPTAIICWDGGVFVAAPPVMLYLKDRDGDDLADVNRVVFDGFSRSNVQGLMNSLRWGLDNRIHGATGTSGGKVTRPDKSEMSPVDLRGRDFSFDPRLLDIRAETGGAQHGMCFDDWGRKYCCSNSDHLQFVVYDQRYAERNPDVTPLRSRRSIAADGPQAPVFRKSPVEPWRIVRTRLRVAGAVPGPVEGGGTPAGYFTGATGATIYRGDALPAESGRAFIADVGSNLVHRKTLSHKSLVPVATRIDEGSEFLTSTDIWFRPVQFMNGPDGALHILDMSREVIEHPKSLPPIIKQHLDLTSGRDQGRLYRVIPQDFLPRPVPDLTAIAIEDLVAMLAHPNAWHRETASQVLFERQEVAVALSLRDLMATSDSPHARLHAICLAEGLGTLTAEDVALGLADAHPRVRERSIRLAERFPHSRRVQQQLATLVDDDDPRVRLQLAFSIGEFVDHVRNPIATRLFAGEGSNDLIRFAVLTSLVEGVGPVLAELASLRRSESTLAAIRALAQLIGRQANKPDVDTALSVAAELGDAGLLLRYLLHGLSTSRRPSAKQLLRSDAVTNRVDQLVNAARRHLDADDTSLNRRVDAIETLAIARDPDDIDRLVSLLDPQSADRVQLAALRTLAAIPGDAIGDSLLDRWSQLTPAVRTEAFDTLLSRTSWTEKLLTAIESAGSLRLERRTPTNASHRCWQDNPRTDRSYTRGHASGVASTHRGPVQVIADESWRCHPWPGGLHKVLFGLSSDRGRRSRHRTKPHHGCRARPRVDARQRLRSQSRSKPGVRQLCCRDKRRSHADRHDCRTVGDKPDAPTWRRPRRNRRPLIDRYSSKHGSITHARRIRERPFDSANG